MSCFIYFTAAYFHSNYQVLYIFYDLSNIFFHKRTIEKYSIYAQITFWVFTRSLRLKKITKI